MARPIGSMAERFDAGFVAEPNSGCWLWFKALNNKGYGVIGRPGSSAGTMYAHRYSYELHRGSIPQGLVLDHKCRTPSCVNPDHLEAVTQRENVLRGNNSAQTRTGHCKLGHVLYRTARGYFYCSRCNADRQKLRREASKQK